MSAPKRSYTEPRSMKRNPLSRLRWNHRCAIPARINQSVSDGVLNQLRNASISPGTFPASGASYWIRFLPTGPDWIHIGLVRHAPVLTGPRSLRPQGTHQLATRRAVLQSGADSTFRWRPNSWLFRIFGEGDRN